MHRTVLKTVAIIMYAEAIKFFKSCMAYEWILSACTKLPILQNFDRITLTKEQVLDDECLQTLLCEAESIINGRPLTKVSDDPNDLEPLTPNHLLLLRQNESLPPGLFEKNDTYSRRRWRQVQYLANVFWGR